MRPAPSPKDPTTLGSWALAIAAALDAAGVDGLGLLRRAGVDPEVAARPDARVAMSLLKRVWELSVAATGDPAFALKTPRYVKATTFHALGPALAASRSLSDGLTLIARYFRVAAEVPQLTLSEPGRRLYRVSVGTYPGGPDLGFECVESLLAILVRAARAMRGPNFGPVAVMMKRPLPANPKPYYAAFGVIVEFSARVAAIDFDRREAHAQIAGAHPDVARANEEAAAAYLARRDSATASRRVEEEIKRLLADGPPTRSQVAKSLRLSVRTLQRRLVLEGNTFRDLVDRTRRELAASYLGRQDQSVSDVALRLGFSDVSSFSRAHRRWTGLSPRGARRKADAGEKRSFRG
jgi:AraC-like DNA-binding protein